MINMSKHATKRMQQRDFNMTMISFLQDYGFEVCAGNTAKKIQLPKMERKRVIDELKKLIKMLEKDPYIILSNKNHIITVAKNYY